MQLVEVAQQKVLTDDLDSASECFEAALQLDELSMPAALGSVEVLILKGMVKARWNSHVVLVSACYQTPHLLMSLRQTVADIG